MRKRDVEILAPAGSFECLKAAVCAGADAVYVGGSRFGARAYADNFKEAELLEALDYVHLHGRKLYLTVNTLLKEQEIGDLAGFLLPYYRQGLDGVIVQDFGAGEQIRNCFPDLELHASTQMTVTGAAGAAFLKEHGYVRVVPARELSLEEIRHIKEETGMEVECFVHGALCYCYSGQCLLSSMIGGRSGNRGQCAQPCRLPYSVEGGKSGDLLSLKDLCTIDLLPELLKAGIDSFKIEGRMKQPDYVYRVTEIYRKYASLCLQGKGDPVSEEDRKHLFRAYQRRGYTQGYYLRHNGKDMISLKRPAVREEEEGGLPEWKIQEKINGKFIISPGKRVKLILECKDVRAECEGPVPEQAKKQPLTADRVEKQLRKTGQTPFVFEHLEIQMDGDFFLPMQAVNELRREGLQDLEDRILQTYRRDPEAGEVIPAEEDVLLTSCSAKEEKDPGTPETVLSVSVQSAGQFTEAATMEGVGRIYVDSRIGNRPVVRSVMEKTSGEREYYLAMPYIFREDVEKVFEEEYGESLEAFDGVLIRNLESLMWLRKKGYTKPVRGDYNLYVCNRESRKFLHRQGLASVTASVELHERELAQLGIRGETMIVYGFQPVMVTANCIRKTTGGCEKKSGYLYLSDRYRKKFAVRNCCEYCYNIIYNSAPLFLADQADKIRSLNPGEVRLDFCTESAEEVREITGQYRRAFLEGKPVKTPETEFTRGHFKRGVK